MPVSKYYTSADGCKIAVDLYLPDHADKPIPLVAAAALSGRKHLFKWYGDFIGLLLQNQYAVALIDPRGIGASYGTRDGFFGAGDAGDIAAVLDKLAEEDWCSKSVGMFGASNAGFIQLLVAAERPRYLKAIIPRDCNTDFYYQNFVNGATVLPNFVGSAQVPAALDDTLVDETDIEQLSRMHAGNLSIGDQYRKNMFRDTFNPAIGYAPNMVIPTWNRMDSVRYSDIAVFYSGGWYDSNVTGIIAANKYWGGKLVIGPWKHVEDTDVPNSFPNAMFVWERAYLTFFNETLKGIHNGTWEEPAVCYYTVNEQAGSEWKYAPVWPVDGTEWTDLYLTASNRMLPNVDDMKRVIPYRVDRTINLNMGYGRANRALGASFSDQNKCVCLTTAPLAADTEITGIPVADLWVTSTAKDGLFIAMLEELLPDGTAQFITDGAIRAAHAKIHPQEIWDALGIPYHRGFEADALQLDPETPMNLIFNLEAISYVVRRDSRLRLCICCGSDGTYTQPDGMPDDTEIGLHTGGRFASLLRLPTIDFVSTFIGELNLDLPGDKFVGTAALHVFDKTVYMNFTDQWRSFPCRQVYQDGGDTVYETASFTVRKTAHKDAVSVRISESNVSFSGQAARRDRSHFAGATIELPKYRQARRFPAADNGHYYRNIHVATVPNRKGEQGFPNVQPYDVMPLLMDLVVPKKQKDGQAPFPCLVHIHGYGGSHHEFPEFTQDLLGSGFAVASVDYRTYPPNIWPAPGHDVKGMIRYLKAHSGTYHLDPDRFGVIGGSAGGHLSAMISATNGSAETEGNIGGNTDFDSSVKAAAIYFPWTDIFSFGDDIRAQYPNEPERPQKADGPFAPLGAIIGFGGPGKGLGALNEHLGDSGYRPFVELAKAASPITHVGSHSAPSVFVHGIYEYGVEIPMEQSVRMFRAMTQHGVKSLLLCNNNGPFGSDSEVRQAVLEFLLSRI